MRWTRRMAWPVPPVIVGVVVAAVAASTSLHVWPLFTWPTAEWVRVCAAFHESLVLAGPVLAGCAAWVAGMFTSRSSLMCPASAPRSGPPLVIRQLGVLCGAAMVGYALPLTPLVASTALRATADGPHVLVMASGVAGLLIFAPAGYLIGTALPRWAGILTAVVVSFAFVLSTGLIGREAVAITPVWLTGLPAPGLEVNPILSTFRVFFFLVLAASCVIAAARWVSGRSPATLHTSLVGVSVLILPAVLALPALARPVEPLKTVEDPPQVCTSADGVDVCVHQARAHVLEPLTNAVADTMRTAGLSGSPLVNEVHDAALWSDDGTRGRIILHLQLHDRQRWLDRAALDVAGEVSGARHCHRLRRDTVDMTGAMPDEYVVSEAVARWVWAEAGYAGFTVQGGTPVTVHETLNHLTHLDGDRVRDWIAAHHSDLFNCDLGRDDLP